MGLARAAVKLIAEIVRDHRLSGRVLVIGKQDVWGTEQDVRRWLGESGLTPAQGPALLSQKPDFRRLDFIQDTSLFRLMGFRDVVTLDNSDYEGVELIFDLNLPVSEELLARTGRFELVVDAGCLEHIFNAPQVLKNFYRLSSDRGVVVHVAPSSNHLDHGFYMFSPTFFHDYYRANRWDILSHYLFRYSQGYRARWRTYEYIPGALFPLSFGGLGRGIYGIFMAARKREGSTCDANVQQGVYLDAWSHHGRAPQPATLGNRWRDLRERLKPHVPRALVSFLMTAEAKIKAVGGLSRYLKHYRDL